VDFNLDRLRAFIVVARTGNLSAAAKELKTTQPNLGRQMTALEKEVRLTLFVRHSRGLHLTKQGQDFLELCNDIVGQLAQRTDIIREKELEPEGLLKVSTGTGSYEDIIKCIYSFSQRFPKLSFQFSSSINVLQLQIGDSDVAFSPILFNDPDLIHTHIYDMVLRIYATPQYLRTNPKPNTLNDLKSHRLIVFNDEKQEHLNLHISGQDIANHDGSFIKVNSGPSMRLALLNHLGIGSYPYDKELVDKNILVDIFPEMPDHKIPYYCVYHRRLENSPKVKIFLEILKEAVLPRIRPST
jgi:DNA-binding transcriptional LysR family regulator